MARRKRYAKATVDGKEHVFEFNVEELDNKRLIADALGVRLSDVRNVSSNSAKPGLYANAQTNKHQYQVDYKVADS